MTRVPASANHEEEEIGKFLAAWLEVRQIIQAANFNHFQRAGLSATQFMTLNLLPERDVGISIGELARRMNLKPATVARTVDSLEARKMLARSRSTADGRLILVRITKAGRLLQNAAAENFRGHMGLLFQAMAAPQRRALVTGLESLVSAAKLLGGSVTPAPPPASPAKRNARQSPPR
jgi:DNA-binding MarR family transcriptional regulator